MSRSGAQTGGSGQLAWAPPKQSASPTTHQLLTSFESLSYGPAEDVILTMPATARTSSLTVTGGRHIRLIGGQGVHQGSGAFLHFTNVTGSVFLEGLDLDLSAVNADAINASGVSTAGQQTFPDIYIQNCRIHGVNGTNATTHADIFQPQGPVGRLFVDKLSGRSNYQGFFLAPQSPILEAHFSRVDLGYEAGGDPTTYLLWLLDSTSQTPYPVSLQDVYATPRSGQNLADHVVWPASSTAGGIGAQNVSVGGQSVAAWPNPMRVAGVVRQGSPVQGDFVPSGSVGLGYVSPGYQAEAPLFVGANSGSKAPQRQGTGHCFTVDPRATTTAAAFGAANRCMFMRVQGSKRSASALRITVGTASGNVSFGVYPNNGANGKDALPAGPAKVQVGSTVCPASPGGTVALPSTVDVDEGDWVGFACDNVTATFGRAFGANDANMVAGLIAAQNTAFPAPSTPTSPFVTGIGFYVGVE